MNNETSWLPKPQLGNEASDVEQSNHICAAQKEKDLPGQGVCVGGEGLYPPKFMKDPEWLGTHVAFPNPQGLKTQGTSNIFDSSYKFIPIILYPIIPEPLNPRKIKCKLLNLQSPPNWGNFKLSSGCRQERGPRSRRGS